MSEKIIFATGNAGKLKEIREILKDLNREIVTMREAGFEGEIEENGTTFREKQRSRRRQSGRRRAALCWQMIPDW